MLQEIVQLRTSVPAAELSVYRRFPNAKLTENQLALAWPLAIHNMAAINDRSVQPLTYAPAFLDSTCIGSLQVRAR